MRDKRTAKTNEYILVGGFSLGQAGHVPPSIILARGNAYGEEHVMTLRRFDAGTPYHAVTTVAKSMAAERGVKLGRVFTREEWNGLEFDSPEWKAWKAEHSRA